jgi:hypothetical protein
VVGVARAGATPRAMVARRIITERLTIVKVGVDLDDRGTLCGIIEVFGYQHRRVSEGCE